jgi:hypothetical protein
MQKHYKESQLLYFFIGHRLYGGIIHANIRKRIIQIYNSYFLKLAKTLMARVILSRGGGSLECKQVLDNCFRVTII